MHVGNRQKRGEPTQCHHGGFGSTTTRFGKPSPVVAYSFKKLFPHSLELPELIVQQDLELSQLIILELSQLIVLELPKLIVQPDPELSQLIVQ